MKNIIFIAPPAAGKGTQSKLVSLEYNIPHISTGDLLRDEVNTGSVLGKQIKEVMDCGSLIPNNIIVDLLRRRISMADCNDGYILDGYPRNLEQAEVYNNLLRELGKDIGMVIFLDIDKNLALKRTMGRIICGTCGASFNRNVSYLCPKIDGICDKCGHLLKVRDDDNENTFNNRYDTYVNSTKPLLNFYKNMGVLKEVHIKEEYSVDDIFYMVKDLID